MTIELNETEIKLIQKSLISSINKYNKNVNQLKKRGHDYSNIEYQNNVRKILLDKLTKIVPLKFEYHDTRD